MPLITATPFKNLFTQVSLQQTFAGTTENNARFTNTTGMSQDGNVFIMGAFLQDSPTDGGQAYGYIRSGNTLGNEFEFTPTTPDASAFFGVGPALNFDGTHAIIGAYFDDADGANDDRGVIYAFERTGVTWSQTQRITILSGTQNGQQLGLKTSMSSDGLVFVAGAARRDENGTDAGVFYIFTRPNTSSNWVELQKLQHSDVGADDRFSEGLFISQSGNTIIASTTRSDQGGTFRGSSYIFTASGSPRSWAEVQKISPPVAQNSLRFGNNPSLSADEITLTLQASGESLGGTNRGACYIYTKSGGTYTQTQKIVSPDPENNALFGRGFISPNGQNLIIGSTGATVGAFSPAGRAYVYFKEGGTFVHKQTLDNPTPVSGDDFGQFVHITNDGLIVIGGQLINNTGEAYVYK